MKKKLVVLLAALVGVSALATSASALSLSIEVGDRPYYQGANFWDWGWYYVWVPGHWDRRHRWVHGYYMRQGDWNRRHLHKRHNWRHHDHDHHDDHHHHH
jgi:hypothetical protein